MIVIGFSRITNVVIDARGELRSEAKATLVDRPTFEKCTNFSKRSPLWLLFGDPNELSLYICTIGISVVIGIFDLALI